MAEKIVYLLGAGASAGKLSVAEKPQYKIPITNALPQRLEGQSKIFKAQGSRAYGINEQKLVDSFNKYCDNLLNIAKGAIEFGSPDTYAKYLYINNKMKELKELKDTLSFYFSYLQLVDKCLDERYISLFTTLMNKNLDFPNNVKFLTWNYDFQILSAITKIIDTENKYWPRFEDRLENVFKYYPSQNGKAIVDKLNYNQLSLLYLNGVSGHYKSDKGEYYNYCESSKGSLMQALGDRSESLINFGWEEKNNETILEIAKALLEHTTILVVIGYSFPFFNRDIDKKLLEFATYHGTLKKIYVQDPYYDGQNIKNQFNINVPIIQRRDIAQLLVPYEL